MDYTIEYTGLNSRRRPVDYTRDYMYGPYVIRSIPEYYVIARVIA